MDPDGTAEAGLRQPARRRALRMAGLAFAAAVCGGVPGRSGADPTPRRVLIVHSFGREFAPFDLVVATFRRELASRASGPIVFLEATLDAGREIGPEEEASFAAYLKARFAEPVPDLIVGIGPPAARFLVRHRDDLPHGTPLLLASIEERLVPASRLRPGDAVVAGHVDIPRILDAILRVLPQTRTIALVIGSTPLERFWEQELQRESASFRARVGFTFLGGLTLAQVKGRVAALPPDSAVLYAMFVADAAGVPFERRDAFAELEQVANVPIFSPFEAELGQGVVGGPHMSHTSIGREAARLALRALSAAPAVAPEVITIAMSPGVYDARELQRWRIDESRLPPGSEVRFREPSAWVQHRKEIVAASGVIVAQAALIAALLVQRAHRRRAEREARALGGRLITAHEDEGRRLARELHDDITQRLAGVSIEAATLGRLADPGARQAAEQSIGSELAALSRDVHALSYRLHPSVVDDLGLSEALRMECERASRRGAVEIGFDGDDAGRAARGDHALCLFRVAQEALRNALRHAQPQRVRVALRAEDGGTRVSVVDDGCGFDPSAQRDRPSLGLASMHERVALLGGRLEVRSRRGQGTTVTAWVPAGEAA